VLRASMSTRPGSISRSRSTACRARWYRTARPTPRSSR
jgi:hypothetical protein